MLLLNAHNLDSIIELKKLFIINYYKKYDEFESKKSLENKFYLKWKIVKWTGISVLNFSVSASFYKKVDVNNYIRLILYNYMYCAAQNQWLNELFLI